MASKRYFFVHLAIFAGVCGTFAISGLSAYRDYLEREQHTVAADSSVYSAVLSPAAAEENGSLESSGLPDSPAAENWQRLEPEILALGESN